MADAGAGANVGAQGTQVVKPPEAAPAADTHTPQSLKQRVLEAIENLTILRVTTVVGNVHAIDVDKFHRVTTLVVDDANQSVASTSIDMTLGDSSTVVAPIFVQDAAYQKLHDDAFQNALKVRKSTIDMLEAVFEKFAGKLGL